MGLCDSLVPLKVFPLLFRAKIKANDAVWMKSQSDGMHQFGLADSAYGHAAICWKNRDQVLNSPLPPLKNNRNDQVPPPFFFFFT